MNVSPVNAPVAEMIGSVAAVCTTVSLLPQLLRVWRLKTARDVSMGMFLLFSTGLVLWLVYGILIHSVPVELANSVSFVLSAAILILKLHYDRLALKRPDDSAGEAGR